MAMNLQVPQVGGVTRSVRYSIAGAMGGDGRQSVCLIPFAADRKLKKSWIECTFQKRDCIRFISSKVEPERCGCGELLSGHTLSARPSLTSQGSQTQPSETEEHWSISRHTEVSPTNAFGTIEFQGTSHPLKAQYVRLVSDSRPEHVLQLLTREWQLELPKLLITVHGGKANFHLQAKLKKVLCRGLVRAAKTTGAWIFTGGTNTGVTRHVGEALLTERTPQLRGRVVAIGIAPWGIIENRKDLIGAKRVVQYYSISSPKSRFAVLNQHHSYFVLADNGTTGKYGAEIGLRKRLEKHISRQRFYHRSSVQWCGIPVVCVIVEGGLNTVRTVLEYVTDLPPVPVVVCDGSGRAADLIAFAHRYIPDDESKLPEGFREQLITTIEKTFQIQQEQAEQVYVELLQSIKKKDLITVFRMGEGPCKELDQAVLSALLKGQYLPPVDQLNLALTWNRADIARSEIFVYGQEWPPGALEQAMMDALAMDRVDFVQILLENGVSMHKFLTIPRLEELYSTKHGPSNTFRFLVKEVRKNLPSGYRYTLYDIGLVVEKLMGGAYRSAYCRRKFRNLYSTVMRRMSTAPTLHTALNTEASLALLGSESTFSHPFNELLIWAVLMKRQRMAIFMWQNGEEAIVKALVASRLYWAMAHEAAQDDLEADASDELRQNAREFEKLALDLLDYCYRQDENTTLQMLTHELQNWSKQTCLGLAVAANHSGFLAHTANQMLLAELWMGALRTRKNVSLKVILGLLFPPTILWLEFKSKEELQLMPQTEEEHYLDLQDDEEDSNPDVDDPPGGVLNPPGVINLDPDTLGGPLSRKCSSVFNRLENGSLFPADTEAAYLKIRTRKRPLKLGRKIYEFYAAPVTKFWSHAIAYGIFLCFFTYVVLVKMRPEPTWQEVYVIAYIVTLAVEKVREAMMSEPENFTQKILVWAEKKWNPCDVVVIGVFLVGMFMRFSTSTHAEGRLLYCLTVMYWYIRLLDILSVNKYLGPYVTMIGKMVINMMYFVVLLLVILMSYGVARQSILHPQETASWGLIKNIFFMPYWMIYGEVFADSIDPVCKNDGEPGEYTCQPGSWINPAIMAVYLLVANILLVNLLIAVFNNIFIEVNAISQHVWKSQRFTVVMEYEQKPLLPPPLIVLSHLHLAVKCGVRWWKGKSRTFDHGLKLFLDEPDIERIHDFEQECVEGYFREQEVRQQMTTENRVFTTTERVDAMSQRVEDIHQWEMKANATIQGLDIRLTQLENLAEQISSSVQRLLEAQDLDDDSGSPSAESDHTASPADYSPRTPSPPPSLPPQPSASSEQTSEVRRTEEPPPPVSPKRPVMVALSAPDGATVAPPDLLVRQGSGRRRPGSIRRRTAHQRLSRQLTVATNEVLDLASQKRKNLQRWQSVCQPEIGGGAAEPQLHQTAARQGRLERGMSCVSRWTEPRPATTSRAPFLSALRGEYTSITDELESTACLLPPPESPTSPAPTPMVAAIAAETEILRDAEAADYQMMGGIIQRRLQGEEAASLEELSDFAEESDVEEIVGTGSRRLMIRVTPARDDDSPRRRASLPSNETPC
ncbi:transient receptor potential cation channel, subfamily M [Amblyomma americanum]